MNDKARCSQEIDIHKHNPIWTIFVLCGFVALLMSCQDKVLISPSVTPLLSLTSTLTPLPTVPLPSKTLTATSANTLTATSTFAPNETPYSTLPPQGPYLMYENKDGNSLVIVGANGQGRRVVDFPTGGYIRDIQQAVSPDGKWLAFFNGSDEWFRESGFPPNLSLSLLYIPDGSIRTITPLLPDNRDDVPTLKARYLLALDWSPDGRQLAFAGAMNGVLADLYIYDLDTKIIRRLTDSSFDISRIDWSPDGKWIWFDSESMAEGGVYEETSMYVIDANNDAVQRPQAVISGLWNEGLGWVKSDLYFLLTQSEGCCGPHDFRYFSVSTMQPFNLWGPSMAGYAIDPKNGILAISNAPEMETQGSFLVDLNGKSVKFSDGIFWEIVYRGGQNSEFLGFDGSKVMGISANGMLTQISDKPFENAIISPDNRLFVLYHAYNQVIGMDLFSESDQFIKTISERDVSTVIWRPDSKGLIFIADGLFYYAIPDGNQFLIDSCAPKGCGYWYSESDFVWLP